MNFILIFTVFMGIAAVLQGGVNRFVAAEWGLAKTVLFNNAVLLIFAIVFFVVVQAVPDWFPESFRNRGNLKGLAWWFLVPGLCGLTIVAGIPYAIGKIGAATLFIGLIGSQLVASLVWDVVVEKIPVTPYKIAAAVLALGSVVLSGWSGKNG